MFVNTPCGRECLQDTAEGAIRPESLRQNILRGVAPRRRHSALERLAARLRQAPKVHLVT